MPSKSKSQQRLFGMVHAMKTGKLDTSDMPEELADKVRTIAKTVSKKSAKDFAKTKTKGKPERVVETDICNLTFSAFLQYSENGDHNASDQV